MKKIISFLTILLMVPFVVSADTKPKVLTLSADVSSNIINYSGTTESGSHAVMCKLYNSSDELVNNISVPVDNKSFSGSFNTNESGDYTVACANYEGGEIKTVSVSIQDAPTIYTVTFNSNGGTQISPVDIESGKKVSKPQDPENGNKVFGGWFSDEELKNEFDFNTPITSNIELFAKWADKVRVDFDTRCEQLIESIEVISGEKITKPQDPENGNKEFGGWFSDEELKNEFDFNTPITTNMTLHALWNDKKVPYEVSDSNGNIVSFTEEEGHSYTLEVTDYMLFTDEQLEDAGISKELYNQVLDQVKNAVKKDGTLIAFYEIILKDEIGHDITDKPVNIKIKITDEMKKYNTFKLFYIKDDFTTEASIVLTKKGDYLVGTLPHLSTYALTGSIESSNNPLTGDNIYMYTLLLATSVVGFLFVSSSLRKRSNND